MAAGRHSSILTILLFICQEEYFVHVIQRSGAEPKPKQQGTAEDAKGAEENPGFRLDFGFGFRSRQGC